MLSSAKIILAMIVGNPALRRWKKIRWKSRPELYDILYSLPWGHTVYNNYGFAPAETDAPEQFQIQLYCELTKLLNGSGGQPVAKHMLEISCGRGGGLCHLIDFLSVESHAIGLDFSINAIRYCTHRYAGRPNVAFVCGHALRLPFPDRYPSMSW
jgi:methyltransferase family protein